MDTKPEKRLTGDVMQEPQTQDPWPLDAEQLQQVVSAVMEVINGSTDPRERLPAVRTVLSMEQQNMQWDQKRDNQLRAALHRLAKERGIRQA